ncbi:MAG: AsmA family protein [Thermoanaerobaculia bacterium]
MKKGLRIVGWGLVAGFCLVALLVIATNVLLHTRLLRKLVNTRPEALTIEYSGAASWLPGRLSLDTVTLRSRDRKTEFEVVLEGVTLRVSVFDLAKRWFHVESLRARALTFKLRELLTLDEATPERVARYPRIEGFADPPLLPATPRPPASGRTPWRIVIDDLAVTGVQEIWIDSWRWTGTGQVVGSFEILAGREARVGPARLEVAGGALKHGASNVARRTVGAVWCELPRFRKAFYPGNEVWKIMSGGSDLKADLVSLEILLPDSSGGTGTISERIDLKDGVGSVRVEASVRDVRLRRGERAFRGTAHIDVRSTRFDFHRGEASLAGTKVVLSDVTVEGRGAPGWGATFLTPAARLRLADGSFDGRVVGSLRDARPIVALMPSGLPRLIAEILQLEDLELTGRLAGGPSRLELTSLRLSAGNFSLVGSYRSRAGRARGDFRARKGPFSVRFSVPGGG